MNTASTPPAPTTDQLSNATHSDTVLDASILISAAHSIIREQPPLIELEQTVPDAAAVKAEGLGSPKIVVK